jgi:eukaryotic-like serine/threonine-protein kinase
MATPSQLVGQTLGHYRILEEIGAGGMGVVYRAHDLRLERDVALKVLPVGALGDEGARRRFRKEALTLSKLSHPNIAMIFDFDTQQGTDFLVTEYIPGITLDARFGHGFLPEKEAVPLGLQLAEGLAAAHERGVVHRDLKPSNLRITSDGRLKILDFGIAQLLPGGEEALTQTLTEGQGITGTLPYMAPEQLQGNAVDVRTDIYAAGAVLYEMITGTRPFEAKLSTALVADITHKPPIPPGRLNPKLSPKLEDIILKCLEKDPENRYQSAKELALDLRRMTSSASSAGVIVPVRAGKKWVWAFAMVGAAALATLVLMFSWNVGGVRERLLGTEDQAIRSIAVLPLENLSRDTEQEYFADGMTEELITELSKIETLRVISRTSVMQYKTTKKTMPEIARELNVDGVIEGSVMRSGDRVRISAQLIRAATDQHVWADSYERNFGDVLSLQSEIARDIAQQVKLTVTPDQQKRLSSVPQVNPEAHDAYLRGRYYTAKGTEDGLARGKEYFEQAIRLDPNYAPAYVGLAYYFVVAEEFFLSPKDSMPAAKAAAQQAVELDNTLSEAHSQLAFAYYGYDWNWAGAEAELQRAIQLDPNNASAHAVYGNYLVSMGRFQEGVAEARRSVELDPLSLDNNVTLGATLVQSRRTQEGIEQLRKTIDMDPNYFFAYMNLAFAYEQSGRFEDAVTALEKARRLEPRNADVLGSLGQAYALAGKRREALQVLAKLKEWSKVRYVPAYRIAATYVGLRDHNQGLLWLNKAYRDRTLFMTFLKADSWLDPLRSDPRFQELMRRVGLPQ